MAKVTTFLYTFIDEETGEFDDIAAPNESAARLWLGGKWILDGRCPLFSRAAEVGEWEGVVNEAQVEAANALDAMNTSMPKPGMPGTMTTTESFKSFNDAKADYERRKARVSKLVKMMLHAGPSSKFTHSGS
jgi:hypothetical protein